MEIDERKLEKFVRRYETATAKLIEANKALAAKHDDQYVTWDWVCWYLNISKQLAEKLLSEQEISIVAKGVERFLRSDIMLFAKRNKVKVYERAAFYLTKAPVEKRYETVSNPAIKREEMRAQVERNMMKFIADTDKRIAGREAFKEKKRLQNQVKPKKK